MALVTTPLLRALETGFKGEFQRIYEETASDYEHIATLIPSSTSSNTYGWLGQFPSLSEWIGDRALKDIQEHGYAIANKLHETSIAIKRTCIEDDELGIYKPLFGEMGRAAKVFPDELVFSLLAKGVETTCYDGKNFFAENHPVFPHTNGTGKAAAASNFAPGDAPAWYLLDCSRVLKPVIFQERTKPEMQSLIGEEDESVFMRDEYRYGVRYRCNVGFAFWQLAYCSKLPLTQANFDAAYDAMAAQKADGGRPLGVRATHLVVPTKLRTSALEICTATRTKDGADNINAGLVTPIVTPWLN